jgi:hypothetical protein
MLLCMYSVNSEVGCALKLWARKILFTVITRELLRIPKCFAIPVLNRDHESQSCNFYLERFRLDITVIIIYYIVIIYYCSYIVKQLQIIAIRCIGIYYYYTYYVIIIIISLLLIILLCCIQLLLYITNM